MCVTLFDLKRTPSFKHMNEYSIKVFIVFKVIGHHDFTLQDNEI